MIGRKIGEHLLDLEQLVALRLFFTSATAVIAQDLIAYGIACVPSSVHADIGLDIEPGALMHLVGASLSMRL